MDVYTLKGNAIICSNNTVTKEDFQNFFKTKFSEVKTNPNNPFFLKGTTFWTFTGTHGKSDGKQGNPAGKGMDEHDNVIGKIEDDFKDIIETMHYTFEPVEYIGRPYGTSGINSRQKRRLDKILKDFKDQNCPNVLILAFCFSTKNELKHFMYQHGILSFATLKNERGEITDGKMFLLDKEQKDLIKTVVEDESIKDCILAGTYIYTYCFFHQNPYHFYILLLVYDYNQGRGNDFY